MGWRYRYILLPPEFDIDTFRATAVKAGFQDMSKLADASAAWEKARIDAIGAGRKDRESHTYSKEELETKSKAFMKFFNKEPEDEELRRYRAAELSQDLQLYQLWFNQVDGRYIMFYTSFGYDIKGDFLTIAMAKLCELGVRGSVWTVTGNSVTDTVNCDEYTIIDSNIFHMVAKRTGHSDEGNYRKFISEYKETGADLKAIHEALMSEAPGRRLPTVMLGKYLDGSDDNERWGELMKPFVEMHDSGASSISKVSTNVKTTDNKAIRAD